MLKVLLPGSNVSEHRWWFELKKGEGRSVGACGLLDENTLQIASIPLLYIYATESYTASIFEVLSYAILYYFLQPWLCIVKPPKVI